MSATSSCGIKTGGAGLLDHAGRQVDADEMIDILGESGSAKAGAAAEIDRALEEGRLLRRRARDKHRLEQQLRRAIIQIAKQRGLEARRILIEQV